MYVYVYTHNGFGYDTYTHIYVTNKIKKNVQKPTG